MDVHGWSAALKLSTKWRFQEIRDRAIKELDGMSPIQKISKGMEYVSRSGYLMATES